MTWCYTARALYSQVLGRKSRKVELEARLEDIHQRCRSDVLRQNCSIRAAASETARSPTVDSPMRPTIIDEDEAECSRWRASTSATKVRRRRLNMARFYTPWQHHYQVIMPICKGSIRTLFAMSLTVVSGISLLGQKLSWSTKHGVVKLPDSPNKYCPDLLCN